MCFKRARIPSLCVQVLQVKKGFKQNTRGSADKVPSLVIEGEDLTSRSPDRSKTKPQGKGRGGWGFRFGPKQAHHATHRRTSSADNPVGAPCLSFGHEVKCHEAFRDDGFVGVVGVH